jgi:multiple antibiotic resistance protein
MLEFFLPTFTTLFVIADPLGTAAIFLALSQGMTDAQVRSTALRASIIAAVLMIVFGLTGKHILPALGISIPAFRIAGGLLLFVTAYRMVMNSHAASTSNAGNNSYRSSHDIAVFPIAIPLLCGPGCMTASILLMDKPTDWYGRGEVIAGMIAVQVVAFICLRYAPRLHNTLGDTGTGILARVFGVLLAAMAIQFIADGIQTM